MKLEIETLKTKVPGWYNSFKTNNQQEREGERQRETGGSVARTICVTPPTLRHASSSPTFSMYGSSRSGEFTYAVAKSPSCEPHTEEED